MTDAGLPPIGIALPRGFRAAGVSSGLKKGGALDLGLLVADAPCSAAGVFTRNLVQAAPVLVSRAHLAAGSGAGLRGVVLNSGCANAVTGEEGLRAAQAMCGRAAEAVRGTRPEEWLVMSTGVIGVPLDMEKVVPGIDAAARGLDADGGLAFARAMMTTDTREKMTRHEAGGATFTGFAKGAGMIHPDMATMLAVILTDAVVTPAAARDALLAVCDRSFNAISVDGDTSTNDTVVLLASGASGVELGASALREALLATSVPLARAIVSDGEGVRHVVALDVEGARSDEEARRIARTVATSLLVKTAVFGGDPNWGRFLAAAGRSGVPLELGACSLRLCGTLLLDAGTPVPFEKADVAARMSAKEWEASLRVGEGPGSARVWFSDLSYDYVRINSEYTT